MQERKKLGLFDLVSLGVGSVVGAGIFSMLSTGFSMTGRSIAFALVFAMLITFLQQIRSIFTASMFALDGGMYSQQALVLPKLLTGMTSVIFIISNLTFSIFGISIAEYLSQLFPVLAPHTRILSVIILTFFFLVSIKGTGLIAKIQNVMAICMYGSLMLFVAFGISKVQPGGFAGENYMISGVSGFLMAAAIMSFTCNGATNIINMSADAKNPKINIPLGVLITTAICAVIYFLLGYVASGVMPYSQAGQANLGHIAQNILPHSLYVFFIIGGAVFSLATSLLGGIAAISAPILAGAEDGWLPEMFTRKTKTGYPYMIMLLMYLVAVIPAVGGFSLENIVSFILVPSMALGIISNIKSFKLPQMFPEAWDTCSLKCPYWLYVALIVLSIVASLITALFSLLGLDLFGLLGNVGLTVFLIVYSWYRLKKGYVTMKSIGDIKG